MPKELNKCLECSIFETHITLSDVACPKLFAKTQTWKAEQVQIISRRSLEAKKKTNIITVTMLTVVLIKIIKTGLLTSQRILIFNIRGGTE